MEEFAFYFFGTALCSLLRPSVPCRSIPTRAILAGKRDATREAAREERQAIRTSAWGTRRVLAELAQFTTLDGEDEER